MTDKTENKACGLVGPVFLAYVDELRAYLIHKVGDASEGEEIMSLVMMKVYNACEKLPDVQNVRAWLYRITHNALIDYFRDQKKSGTALPDELIPEEETSIYNSMEALLPAMIAMLPREYADALRWSDLEGMPQKDIAERLGLSLSGAKSKVQRGRKKLRELFTECTYLELNAQGAPLSYTIKSHCTPLLDLHPLLEKDLPAAEGENCGC